MSELILMLVGFVGVPADRRERAAAEFLSAVGRYALTTMGPIAVSSAHFFAAFIFLHSLPRAQFGSFSFLFVLSPFCLSLCGAMFAPPIARRLLTGEGHTQTEQETLFKAGLTFSALIAVAVGLVMELVGDTPSVCTLLAMYSGLMSLRWFSRCWMYGLAETHRVAASDLSYSGLLLASLLLLFASNRVSMWSASVALVAAATIGFVVFGAAHLRQYWTALWKGQLAPFLNLWREMSGWAVLGVVLSEATANAHAYLVTFLSGPHAFAVLAVGGLLMRPVSLVLFALPDVERPRIAKALHGGNLRSALRIVNEFRTAGAAMWLATIALAASLLTWAPHLFIKKDYALGEVLTAVAVSATIVALRALRTPESVLLQAAGEFRPLIGPGLWSSAVSLMSAFLLLILAGPIAAFFGILLGELVATERTMALARSWKRMHA